LTAVRVIGLKETITRIKQINTELPKVVRQAQRSMGDGAVGDLKASLTAANVESYNGELYGDGIRAVQRSQNLDVEVVEHGIMLDGMRPHWVRVDATRPELVRWATQARNNNLRALGNSVEQGSRKKFSLHVSPHPFIQNGVNRSRGKNAALLRNQLRTIGIGASE
jgi:hypothetical protein